MLDASSTLQPSPAGFPQALTDFSADKRLDVLRRVAAGCSISQAAREVGISYKAAWQAIDTLTNLSGLLLVECTVGGSGGGGARITPQGRQLLALADELARARQQVLARYAGGAQLAAGLGLRTSMRNQLPCQVLSCEPVAPDDPLTWVRLRTPGGAALTASLTRESADLLGLAPGLHVLALCKATAVQVTLAGQACAESPKEVPRSQALGVPAAQPLPVCVLMGGVERVTPGAGQDEVVLALAGGGHWVGFAAHPFSGQVGDLAMATQQACALVVALPG